WREQGHTSLFHCTAGEDRTGALAGLFRMLDEGLSTDEVFYGEMCPRGYSNGNPNKPWKVTGAIEAGLTPLFEAIAEKIEKEALNFDSLEKSLCQDIKIKKFKRRCPRL